MDLPAGMAAHLDRLRDGLQAATDLRGLYLYGSLTTGAGAAARARTWPSRSMSGSREPSSSGGS